LIREQIAADVEEAKRMQHWDPKGVVTREWAVKVMIPFLETRFGFYPWVITGVDGKRIRIRLPPTKRNHALAFIVRGMTLKISERVYGHMKRRRFLSCLEGLWRCRNAGCLRINLTVSAICPSCRTPWFGGMSPEAERDPWKEREEALDELWSTENLTNGEYIAKDLAEVADCRKYFQAMLHGPQFDMLIVHGLWRAREEGKYNMSLHRQYSSFVQAIFIHSTPVGLFESMATLIRENRMWSKDYGRLRFNLRKEVVWPHD
jgi:hypothetical protein